METEEPSSYALSDILDLLKEGKIFKRIAWGRDGRFLEMHNDHEDYSSSSCLFILDEYGHSSRLSIEDMKAKDWMELPSEPE